MKTILAVLALLLIVGCASRVVLPPGVTKKQIADYKSKHPVIAAPVPPKPGKAVTNALHHSLAKMRKVAPVARTLFVPAAVAPSTNVMRDPIVVDDPEFGKTFYATAMQGSNTVLTVYRGGSVMGPWSVALQADCWPEEQSWIAVSDGDFAKGFLQGQNTVCVYQPVAGLSPAMALAGTPENLTGSIRLVKKGELRGAVTNTAWYARQR